MAELHVRNIPADLHERLRERASAEGRSLSSEVVAILRRVLDPPAGGSSRTDAIDRLRRIQARHRLAQGAPPAEALVREDRDSRS
ncbi:MAG: FitA-like ribbon-helix-helix domain-containing protein [Actinomycetes bacterium]